MGAPAYSLLLQWDNLRLLNYAFMDTTYIGIGSALSNPVRIIALYNSTDQDLFISTDGINDKIIIPAQSQRIYDIAANKSTQGGCLFLAAGQRLYARYPDVEPTQGNIYFESAFGSDTGQG